MEDYLKLHYLVRDFFFSLKNPQEGDYLILCFVVLLVRMSVLLLIRITEEFGVSLIAS